MGRTTRLRVGESAPVRRQFQKCPFCQERFIPQYLGQKFCTPQHRKNYGNRLRRQKLAEKKLKKGRTCRYCNLAFVAKKRNQEFCCPEHQKAFWKHGVMPFEKLMATVNAQLVAPLRARVDVLEQAIGLRGAVEAERHFERDVLNAGGGAAA